MEVHAHTNTPRKKWTHYFWEFLMLFLAVFCGFLAENQREHFVEHKREKQFIVALINDLRLDTVELKRVITGRTNRILCIDTALRELSQLNNNEMPISLYNTLLRTPTTRVFYANNGTLTQLRNSGGMRLIRNRSAVDSIEGYDRQIRRTEIFEDRNRSNIHDFLLLMNKLVSGKQVYEAIYDSTRLEKINSKQIIKLNSEYLDEFIHELLMIRRQVGIDIGSYDFVRTWAINMMTYLKKEYNIQ